MSRERPILMDAESVRGVLAGTKTQTRRPARGFQGCNGDHSDGPAVCRPLALGFGRWGWDFTTGGEVHGPITRCPYGVPGDLLWARETWKPLGWDGGWMPVRYRADGAARVCRTLVCSTPHGPEARWRPSIHMPRWASRLLLRVTDVRVERVQDISEEDALWEGCEPSFRGLSVVPARDAFRDRWRGIHGDHPERSWEANPFCWAVSFEVVS